MYRTITVDLTSAKDKHVLVEDAIPIEFVNVRESSAEDTDIALHFGQGGEAVPVYPGDSFDTCIRTGLYLTAPAQAGVTVKIFVSGGGGPRETT